VKYFRTKFTSFQGRRDAERLWHDRQRTGQAGEALPATDLRNHFVATQQQIGQGSSASCRPHLSHRRRHEDLPGANVNKRFFFFVADTRGK